MQIGNHGRQMRLGSFVAALASCVLLPTAALAGVEVELEVDSARISTDDQLILRVTASGDYGDLSQPTSDGFDFRHSGRSTQVRIVGRHMQRSEQHTFNGSPRRPGKYRIGPIIARKNGQEVARSSTINVQVIDSRKAMGPARSPDKATDPRNFAGEAFFVRPVLSSNAPYAGQPFVAEFQLFWNQNTGVQNISKRGDATFEGFLVEDLIAGEQPQQEPVRFAGRRYMRQTVIKVLLTAPVAGRYEIIGPRFRIEAGDFMSTRAYRISAPPIAVAIRPVPEQGQPDRFAKGAIGKMSLRAHLVNRGKQAQSMEVRGGERLVFNIEVHGQGNLLGLGKLEPPPLEGMVVEALPGRPDEGVTVGANGHQGVRRWQYLLSFRQPGTYEIPALEWSCFDPFEERYATHHAGPFQVVVKGLAPGAAATAPLIDSPPAAKPAGAQPALPAPAAQAPRQLALRPIAAHAALARTNGTSWTETPWFWRLAGLPWLAALLLLMGRSGMRWRARGAPGRRQASALTNASQALRAASEQPPQQGYAAMRSAVDSHLRTRCGLGLAGLTYGALQTELIACGAARDDVKHLRERLEHCDFARFAPAADRDDDMERTAIELAATLTRLDEALSASTAKHPNPAAGALVVLLLGAALCWPTPTWAATLDQGFAAANTRFVNGEIEGALADWRALLQHGVQSAAVHYNIGNAHARLDRLGRSVGHYKKALRLEPEPELRANILHNLTAVRAQLGERARRRHRILHVFDESPELEVAVARAAPRGALGFGVLIGGALALLLFGILLLGRGSYGWRIRLGLGLALALHIVAGAWLMQAERVERSMRHGVVVQEDALLGPCMGVGETVRLPEGLELRVLRKRPDGRHQVRLPNGRAGCLPAEAIEEV